MQELTSLDNNTPPSFVPAPYALIRPSGTSRAATTCPDLQLLSDIAALHARAISRRTALPATCNALKLNPFRGMPLAEAVRLLSAAALALLLALMPVRLCRQSYLA